MVPGSVTNNWMCYMYTYARVQLDFVGLKTKEEFKSLKDAHEEQLQKQNRQGEEEEARRREREEKRKKKAKESKVARLSFAIGGDEDGEGDEEEEDAGPFAGRGKKDGAFVRACVFVRV